jgi:hypothetical protein
MRTQQRHAIPKLEGTAARNAHAKGSALSAETLAEIEQQLMHRFDYVGCRVLPSPDAPQSQAKLQLEIAEAFAKQDSPPPERLKSFEWCLSDPRLTCTGWSGVIRHVSEVRNAWQVTVRISPRINGSHGNVTFTPDYCVETWEYADGELSFVESERPAHAMKALFSD